jgi:predicted nucleotidyltransferase
MVPNKSVQTDPRLEQFLNDLVKLMILEYRDEIVSILLFGSAATKDWKKGKSDIDLVIVIKHQNLRKKVEDTTNNIIIKLDRKHNLELTQTCSSYVKHRNPFVNLLYRVEDALTFGKPFFVFSIDQIFFEKSTIADKRISFISAVFDPLTIFLAKMKQTGITIYGQNLINDINYKASPIKKIRISIAPLWIFVMSLISFPLDEKFSLRHSIKATLWACEDSLFALNCPLSNVANEVNRIKDIFGKSINCEHLETTLSLKQRTYKKTIMPKGFTALYLVKTIRFILNLYYQTIKVAKRRNIVCQQV